MKMKKVKNYTLIVFAENKPGVLNKVTMLIRRKMYNVETITAYKTETPGISRITINVNDQESSKVEQIVRQLKKIVEVTEVINVTNQKPVVRELVLIKVKTNNGSRAQVSQLANIFRGNIVDVSQDSMVVEITGNPQKVESAICVFDDYEILEIAGTGITAMERSNGEE
ncbi:MAG: acetolactate synthase small subunit [Candidatus Woesebacteria bacterium]|jgi:acetolactate synthase-1/3 small subunit